MKPTRTRKPRTMARFAQGHSQQAIKAEMDAAKAPVEQYGNK